MQPPRTAASCEVKDTQKILDHPTGCEIRRSVLRILCKKKVQKGWGNKRKKLQSKLKQLMSPFVTKLSWLRAQGLCRRLGSLPWHCSATELFLISNPTAAINPHTAFEAAQCLISVASPALQVNTLRVTNNQQQGLAWLLIK